MTRRLGIELSPTRCSLVDLDVYPAGRHPETARIRSFRSIPWSPENAEPFVATLRLLRKSRILPSRAVVALWGLEGEAPSEAHTRSRLAPLVAAQFAIEAVITPATALAALSRLVPDATPGAVRALVAVNTDATAIAITRGGSMLLGREIPFAFRPGVMAQETASARSASALDFARRLAPEIKRALLAAKQSHNGDVHQVVLCGDFPGLRLLTSPLVTALHVEVETLDSIRGLAASASHFDAALLDQAAALRVAWAAGITGSPSSSLLPRHAGVSGARKHRTRRLVPIAATVLLAVAGWFAIGRPGPMRPARAPKRSPGLIFAAAPKTSPGLISAATPGLVSTGPAVPASRLTSRARMHSAETAAAGDETPPPVVQSILYGDDRRLAMIDHQIVRVGDRLEAGIVTDIEPKAVVVRRRSGRLLRVELMRPDEGK